MVVRLLWLSFIWAQKPKSAIGHVSGIEKPVLGSLTQFDVTLKGEQDVVRLDISVNDALGMQML
jgi:hypothetical protein